MNQWINQINWATRAGTQRAPSSDRGQAAPQRRLPRVETVDHRHIGPPPLTWRSYVVRGVGKCESDGTFIVPLELA